MFMQRAFISKIFVILLLILSSFLPAQGAQTSASSYGEKILTTEQIKTDIELLKKTYKRLHPGYTRYNDLATLERSWDEITTTAEQDNGMSITDFYLRIQSSLTLIRCDHTKANLPKAMAKERNENPIYLPFKWRWIEQRAFVIGVDAENKLSLLDEVVAIDGRDIKELVQEVEHYIPVDGYTEWSRNPGISDSMEFMGGAVDHFGTLKWKNKARVTVSIKTSYGDIEEINMPRINYKEYRALPNLGSDARNFKDAVIFERIGDKAAYLRIDTFVNYRETVDPEDIYKPIFKAIKQEKRDVLILDLRNNGGGSSDASMGLFANLIAEKMQVKTDMRVNTLEFEDIRPHLWTWDKRALDPNRIGFSKNDDGGYSLRSWFTDDLDTIKPTKYAFSGKLIALTSNSNSSGSTNLLSALQSAGRVTMVGEKTGGSKEGVTAGLLFTLTLPESKITTRVPFFRYTNNVKSFELGMGVTPDIYAPMTVEAFLRSGDPALETAKQLIEISK
ncbi:S41 family peptidase [Glaciecola petra]|uniref:S41 family peptidase n=1 Tax=Glaciecola petra TaxID=3075602 RepID=A0ABU2ZQK1_9ALTE|nr:S41 family peptidase [Aestuariibacter sp. P117]MDT0594902.1 S41 family peptidase [Aestuariibacter sp. P117]